MKNDPLFKVLSAAIIAGLIVAAGSLSGCAYPATVVAAPPPPPAPVVEVAGVSPGPGYVWVRGHWAWRYGRYVWIHGRWAV